MGHYSKDFSRRIVVERTNSRTDFSKRKTFSNRLAGSVTDSNKLLFDLFSVNALFRSNEILMFSLSWLSIISSSFYAHVSRTKIWFVNETFVSKKKKKSQNSFLFCTQLNGFNYCYLTQIILFSINHLFAHS